MCGICFQFCVCIVNALLLPLTCTCTTVGLCILLFCYYVLITTVEILILVYTINYFIYTYMFMSGLYARLVTIPYHTIPSVCFFLILCGRLSRLLSAFERTLVCITSLQTSLTCARKLTEAGLIYRTESKKQTEKVIKYET